MLFALFVVAKLVQHYFDFLVQATRLTIDDLLAQCIRCYFDHLLDAPEKNDIGAIDLWEY